MTAYNIVNPTSMQSGQPEDISQVLANFQAIQAVLNGSIDSFNIAAGGIFNANIAGAAAIAPSKFAGYPSDATKFLRGDSAWAAVPTVGATNLTANIGAVNTDLAAPSGGVAYIVATTGGGTLRSIGAPAAGSILTLRNGSASFITLKHALAGGAGAPLSIVGSGDKYLPPGRDDQFVYDGTNWQEINRPSQELICDQVLGGTQASFDTNTILGGNIPGVYTHLAFTVYGRGDDPGSSVAIYLRFNNDSAANYDYENLQASATTPSSNESFTDTKINVGNVPSAGAPVGIFNSAQVEIPAYAGTVGQKTATARWGLRRGTTTGTAFTGIDGGDWRNAAAITRITVLLSLGNFIAGSRFSLYGVT